MVIDEIFLVFYFLILSWFMGRVILLIIVLKFLEEDIRFVLNINFIFFVWFYKIGYFYSK